VLLFLMPDGKRVHLGKVHHLLKLVMEGSKVKKRFLDSPKNWGRGGGRD